jgi:hypothetical protein
MATINQRLQVLEARPPKVDLEHDRRYSAAIKAMSDTVSHRNEWAPSKVAPFNCKRSINRVTCAVGRGVIEMAGERCPAAAQRLGNVMRQGSSAS